VTAKSKSIARFRSPIGIALSVYLAAWLGFFPLLQIAHLTLDSHTHRFCEQHHQIEEFSHEAPSDPDSLRESTDKSRVKSKWITDRAESKPQQHIACSVLNYSTSRDPIVLSDQPAAVIQPGQPNAPASSRETEFLPCPLLLTAPKTSPPIVAA
jgi:hypothetical protein